MFRCYAKPRGGFGSALRVSRADKPHPPPKCILQTSFARACTYEHAKVTLCGLHCLATACSALLAVLLPCWALSTTASASITASRLAPMHSPHRLHMNIKILNRVQFATRTRSQPQLNERQHACVTTNCIADVITVPARRRVPVEITEHSSLHLRHHEERLE
jgi:hypothetical protein